MTDIGAASEWPEPDSAPSWLSFSIAVSNFVVGAVGLPYVTVIDALPLAVAFFAICAFSYILGLWRLSRWFNGSFTLTVGGDS